MSTGILIAIIGYLILAVSTLFDKFLVTQTFKHPLSYAFWLGMLSLSAFVLLPFDFALPEGSLEWSVDLAAGAAFTLSILYYMRGLYSSDASIALPLTGSLSTILTGIFAYLILAERLSVLEMTAIAILLLGFWILMTEKAGLSQEAVVNFAIAGLFFALSNVAMKVVLTTQPFISGLVFSRVGAALVAMAFLSSPVARAAILSSRTVLTAKNLFLTLFGNGLGALGMIGVWFAYQLSSPTVLNALQGIQYAFLAILAFFVTSFWPGVIKEQIDRATLKRKGWGIAVVIVGVALLAGG